jgi:hypothetical protein
MMQVPCREGVQKRFRVEGEGVLAGRRHDHVIEVRFLSRQDQPTADDGMPRIYALRVTKMKKFSFQTGGAKPFSR